MKKIIEKNAANNEGWTPLHWAAQNGHIQVIKAILSQVSNKNPVDNDGETPKEIFLRHATKNDLENGLDWE